MSRFTTENLDWAAVSGNFDSLNHKVANLDLASANEAQTRYDVIDSFIKDVLGWETGQVKVEEHSMGPNRGFVDYILRVADSTIIIEAKRSGAAFPLPTKKNRLKLTGSVLGSGEIAAARKQAQEYAESKNADLVCVTNGAAWCFYSMRNLDVNSYATILFPFSSEGHAERIYEVLSMQAVRDGSVSQLLNSEDKMENRLISILHDADGRINRNNIADHILPALNAALYSDALMSNVESLEKCFVATEGRSRFDSLLGVHLADPKPTLVSSASRIRRGKANGQLEGLVSGQTSDHAPPVTLVIGPVGAGKSTYLKHFELVSGRDLLKARRAHWIYIDFEKMGEEGNPREYIYGQLRDYLISKKSHTGNAYQTLVEPAYEDVIKGLTEGPLALIADNKDELKRRITDYIQSDYDKVEPYVDKLFSYIAKQDLCVFVMDNVDLYENDKLETTVFSEGLALSKRLHVQAIISIRDRTFVQHRNSPIFNAYELRKLWLDPPPFRPVLSNRLTYSRRILSGQSAQIAFENGMHLAVPDIGAFFDIVQRSVLQGPAGEYIENISDASIRRGLDLIGNFLTSGHIQADKALRSYIEGQTEYFFPFHEVFKGTVLGPWKYYKEERADCVNLFDSRQGTQRTRLIRIGILNYIVVNAKSERTLEVPVDECMRIFTQCGASKDDVIGTLKFLQEYSLIRTTDGDVVNQGSSVVITHSGAYYVKKLCRTMVYAEQCMLDTAIDDIKVWEELSNTTADIERNKSPTPERMRKRRSRLSSFLGYLIELEDLMYEGVQGVSHLLVMKDITKEVMLEVHTASSRAEHYAGLQSKIP